MDRREEGTVWVRDCDNRDRVSESVKGKGKGGGGRGRKAGDIALRDRQMKSETATGETESREKNGVKRK